VRIGILCPSCRLYNLSFQSPVAGFAFRIHKSTWLVVEPPSQNSERHCSTPHRDRWLRGFLSLTCNKTISGVPQLKYLGSLEIALAEKRTRSQELASSLFSTRSNVVATCRDAARRTPCRDVRDCTVSWTSCTLLSTKVRVSRLLPGNLTGWSTSRKTHATADLIKTICWVVFLWFWHSGLELTH